MNQESSLNLQALGKYPVVVTKEKVAEALGVSRQAVHTWRHRPDASWQPTRLGR